MGPRGRHKDMDRAIKNQADRFHYLGARYFLQPSSIGLDGNDFLEWRRRRGRLARAIDAREKTPDASRALLLSGSSARGIRRK